MQVTLNQIKKLGEFPGNISYMNRLCAAINDYPAKVYELISLYRGQADTVTREAIFGYIADKYHNGNYDITYDRWLNEQ